jgi:hypothetical protein
MRTVDISDRAQANARLAWLKPTDASEREVHDELIAAMSCFIGVAIEPAVVEATVAWLPDASRPTFAPGRRCILASSDADDARAYADEANAAELVRVPRLTPQDLADWTRRLMSALVRQDGAGTPSLRELDVRSGDSFLPAELAGASTLSLDGYEFRCDILTHGGAAWVPAPPKRLVMQLPFSLFAFNAGSECVLDVVAYSPAWVPELTRPGSPFTRAFDALKRRGWEGR